MGVKPWRECDDDELYRRLREAGASNYTARTLVDDRGKAGADSRIERMLGERETA